MQTNMETIKPYQKDDCPLAPTTVWDQSSTLPQARVPRTNVRGWELYPNSKLVSPEPSKTPLFLEESKLMGPLGAMDLGEFIHKGLYCTKTKQKNQRKTKTKKKKYIYIYTPNPKPACVHNSRQRHPEWTLESILGPHPPFKGLGFRV